MKSNTQKLSEPVFNSQYLKKQVMYGIFKLRHVTPYKDTHALKHEPNNSLYKKTD